MSDSSRYESNGASLAPDGLAFRTNYYAEDAFVKTDVTTGKAVNRAGTRICSLSSDFLLGFHRAITDECGPAAPGVFKAIGRKWGLGFAKRFEMEMSGYYELPLGDFSVAMFEACLVEAFSHHGWGRMKIDTEMQGRGILVVILQGAVMADLLGDTSEGPADALTAGSLAGFFTHLSGHELDCIQTQCSARGAPDSRFVLSLPSRLAAVAVLVEGGATHDQVVAKLAETRA